MKPHALLLSVALLSLAAAGFAQSAHSAQPARVHHKWSPRQSLIFIIGVSALLWAAIVWACIHYL